jgi:CHASE2 domain-containing sensor protein
MAIACLVFAATYFLIHGPEGPQHWSSDLMIAHNAQQADGQDQQIALIYVTDRTLKDYASTAPVDRALLATVVDKVGKAGASVIGLDFVFDHVSETAKDDALVAAINASPVPVVIGTLDQRSATNYDAEWQNNYLARLNKNARLAHLYFDDEHGWLINSDQVVRALPLSDGTRPSFAEALAAPDKPAAEAPSPLQAWLLPVPQIDWQLPPSDADNFITLSAEDIRDSDKPGMTLDLNKLLGGKRIIIGGSLSDRDQHLTPLSVLGPIYPGAWIHAQVLSQILQNRHLYALPLLDEIAVGLVCLVLGAMAGSRKVAEHYHRLTELGCVAGLVLLTWLSFSYNRSLFHGYAHFLFPFSFAFVGGMIGIVAGHYSRLRERAYRLI